MCTVTPLILIMKNLTYFFFAASIVALTALSACEKDKEEQDPAITEGRINLNMKAVWGDEPFSVGTVYSDPFDRPILTESLRAYVSNISVIREDGSEVLLADIALINFNDGATFSAPIPAGRYTGIRFDIGVPTDRNTDQDPAQYPSAHPLSVQSSQGMFWTWNSGYIFVKFEGKVGLDGNPVDMTDPYGFHVGLDQFYRELSFSKSFEIGANATDIDVIFDAGTFLTGPDDTIDLEEDFITHTMSNVPLANRFMNLFSNSIRVE